MSFLSTTAGFCWIVRSIAVSRADQSFAPLLPQAASSVPAPILQVADAVPPLPEVGVGVGVGVGDVVGDDGEPPPPHDGNTNTAAPKATRAKG
jgi:hypothetical protein